MDDLEAAQREFLLGVFDRTGGNPAGRVSMFDVGAALGWDREAASRAAQDLMGLGLLEVRTLSGAIGLSAEGAAAVAAARTPPAGEQAIVPLGRGTVMSPDECRRTAGLCADIRAEPGADRVLPAETEADLRTIAAQLASPRPKTAIVRACLRSLGESASGARSRTGIRLLLGE